MAIMLRITILFTLISFVFQVNASSFQLFEGNTINVGDFGAGGGANLDDASATYFNPAALIDVKCHNIAVAGTFIFKSIDFTGTTGVSNLSRTTGNLVSTPNTNFNNSNASNKISDNSQIPAVFYSAPITNNFVLGIGLSVPFGLATEWGEDSPQRYLATKSEIITLNLGPGFAYRVNKYLVVGGGIDMQYLAATLNSMTWTEQTAAQRVNISDLSDNNSKNKAHGFSMGGNVGVLIKPIDAWTLSLHYRSRVSHSLNGDSVFTGPLATNGPITNQASTNVTLPDVFSANSSFGLTERVKLLAGIYYTVWSTIQDVTLKNISSFQGPVTETLKLGFKDSWRFVVGSEVKLNNKFLVRAGVGYDQTPTRIQDRGIRLPDNDRIAVSVGARYKHNHIFTFEFGYTHLFVDKVDLNHTVTTYNQSATIQGQAKNRADLVSLQVTANIC